MVFHLRDKDVLDLKYKCIAIRSPKHACESSYKYGPGQGTGYPAIKNGATVSALLVSTKPL